MNIPANIYTIAFTGHRPDKLGGYGDNNALRDELKHKLSVRLDHERSVQYAAGRLLHSISGMALGFDQWAVEVCVGLGIPFIAAVPFEGQEARWSAEAQIKYHDLIRRAMSVVVVTPQAPGALPPSQWHKSCVSAAMHSRNRYMIGTCHHLIGAWDGSPGGTANCWRYAERVGRSRENLLDGVGR